MLREVPPRAWRLLPGARRIDTVQHQALLRLGRYLRERGYEFVTVTPRTHTRVNVRAEGERTARPTLRDAFGWSRPFGAGLLPDPLLSSLLGCGLVTAHGEQLESSVRFSSLDGALYAHSAFPTVQREAVFFGPDTYRFCAFVKRSVASAGCVVDVGCGSGAGGLSLAGRVGEIVLADISEQALAFAAVNADLAGVRVTLVQSDVLQGVEQRPDLVIANPPYLRDAQSRTYRDGGGRYGEGLALRIASEALHRLAAGGRLILYSGAAIVEGRDTLREALRPTLQRARGPLTYEELDPDVFGEELQLSFYAGVDRIAAVGLQAVA